MKVTKGRTGYTIRLNTSEFEMLDRIIGMSPPDVVRRQLSGSAKNAHSRRLKATNGDLLAVDKDISDRPVSPVMRSAPPRYTGLH